MNATMHARDSGIVNKYRAGAGLLVGLAGVLSLMDAEFGMMLVAMVVAVVVLAIMAICTIGRRQCQLLERQSPDTSASD
ncbi:MAG: hypothetical protein HY331_02600 [Chloroflexi bacterium]|nr:hypothetical protein [Chloroflexota bacterium]